MRNVWGWAFFAFFDGERPKTNKKGRKKEGKKDGDQAAFCVCLKTRIIFHCCLFGKDDL